ncbi:two component system sensor histidine kinase [Nitzschia inconspicua]|uniref:histidine kinase n=1 Tax=Nitzschia inconspicua TaxID=303405 RepID=A0A9K3KL94_9STRA|nr:two component system sensor histidine kinase [Nitzschia inconspicua]
MRCPLSLWWNMRVSKFFFESLPRSFRVFPSVSFSSRDPSDFAILNCIQQPIWIFDVVRRSMFWANPAALELWNAPTLESLLQRSFKDMSESTKLRLDAHMEALLRNRSVTERWTFYPQNQKAVVVDCTFSGITVEEGRLVMLVQGQRQQVEQSSQQQEALRAMEMIRHLPLGVCWMDLQGNILDQNPDSMAVFGKEATSSNVTTESSTSSFVNRFADPQIGHSVLQQAIQGEEDDTVSIAAEQMNVLGQTQWSSIRIRKTRDPVTSNPVLLCTTNDITDIIQKKEKDIWNKQRRQHQQQQRQQSLDRDVAGYQNNIHCSNDDMSKLGLLGDMANAMRKPLQHVLNVVELLNKQRKQQLEITDDCISLLLQSATLLMTIIDNVAATVTPTKPIRKEVVDNGLDCNQKDIVEEDPAGATAASTTTALETTEAKQQQRHLLRVPTSNTTTHFAPIDIPQVVGRAVQDVHPQAQAKGLLLRIHSYSKSIRQNGTYQLLSGDVTKLHLVLKELLSNAIQHTSNPGTVVVSIKRVSQSHRNNGDTRWKEDEDRHNETTTKHPSPPRNYTYSHIRFEIQDTGMDLDQQEQCLKLFQNDESDNIATNDLLTLPLLPPAEESTVANTSNTNTSVEDVTTVNNESDETKQSDSIPTNNEDEDRDNYRQKENLSPSGLKRCKTLVDALGGTIGVMSQPGEGSLFWLEVPFVKRNIRSSSCSRRRRSRSASRCLRRRKRRNPYPTDGTGPASDSNDNNLGVVTSMPLETVLDVEGDGGLHILLVDDQDVSGSNVMKALLEDCGHTVTIVSSGDEMIASIVDGDYDVVLLETELGSFASVHSRFDAISATRHLRKNLGYSTETLPIVALTAAVPRPDYFELGLNDWLTKPVLVKDIQQAITNAICNLGCSIGGGASSMGSLPSNDESTICSSSSLYESFWEATQLGEDRTSPNRDNNNNNNNETLTRSTSNQSLAKCKGSVDTLPVMPKRRSLASIHSLPSDHIHQAAVNGTMMEETVS